MIWFAAAVSQALLLLSQCRAISSVVIAKQMKNQKKKKENWDASDDVIQLFLFFFSVQMFQHFCSRKKKVENKQLVFPASVFWLFFYFLFTKGVR